MVDRLFHTGAPWQPGLPPGVYQDRTPPRQLANLRSDVAAFVGLAERGPIATPVVLESFDDFRFHFGSSVLGRMLPPSVRLFFENGGRRCVVVRFLDFAQARTTELRLGGRPGRPRLVSGGTTLRLRARNPGSWADTLAGSATIRLLPTLLQQPAGIPAHTLVVQGVAPEVGARLRLVRATTNGRVGRLFWVSSVSEDEGETRIRLDAALPSEYRDAYLLREARELRIDLELGLPDGLRERCAGLALHPSHSRFWAREIGRPAAGEHHLENPLAETGSTPPDLRERLEEDVTMRERDPRRLGSMLVRPLPDDFERPLGLSGISPEDLASGNIDAVELLAETAGSDALDTTGREHAFRGPGESLDPADPRRASVFGGQPSPLESLEAYDVQSERQPVSLVHLPDLLHPDRLPAERAEPEPPPGDSLCFVDCGDEPLAGPEAQAVAYPRLGLQQGLAGVRSHQQQLRDWCEMTRVRDQRHRVAILDLPPGIDRGEALEWSRAVSSDRAALYAPYLEVLPVDGSRGEPASAPPGGAACGIIAARERQLGVQAAPAAVVLSGAEGLRNDAFLPDAGFLHEIRVNAFRATELGFELLGARTTSLDRLWTHLSVRRLLDALARQLALDSRWVPFEPNDALLWSKLTTQIEDRLEPLWVAGAFRGARREDAWFVRCDAHTNDLATRDAGQVQAWVGVAPAAPAEFVVFRLLQTSADARVEEGRA